MSSVHWPVPKEMARTSKEKLARAHHSAIVTQCGEHRFNLKTLLYSTSDLWRP